jgi:hypothetical protein
VTRTPAAAALLRSNARPAGGSGDIASSAKLHATSHYGKLAGKPVSGYIVKAEGYLHHYGRKEGGDGGKHQGKEKGMYGTN